MSNLTASSLGLLSAESRECIERLALYELEKPDLSAYPPSVLAAVLVLLFERAGKLRVLLTTRSKALRAHPGQTALPGGKFEGKDENLIATAYREAFEEVALPIDCPDIHTIGCLEPLFSSSRMVVTPVVAVLTDLTVLDGLKASAGEVAKIFDHPLQALLDPRLAKDEPLVHKATENWPYDPEFHCYDDVPFPSLGLVAYRMHRFRSSASPVKGLTADILIRTAQIAYAEDTVFERSAPGQVHGFTTLSRLSITRPQQERATESSERRDREHQSIDNR